MGSKQQSDRRAPWLSSDSACAGQLAAHDWSGHPLGAIDAWPATLRTAVLSMLASTEPMHLIWGEHRTFLCNDAYAPILGTDLADATGAAFEQVFAEAWPSLEPFIAQGFAGRGSRFCDVAVTHRGQRRGWWTFSYTPVFDPDGQVAGLLCLTHETTEHVLRKTALAASEVRNRQILDSAIDYAIIATDPDGKVVEWNKGAQRILGWSEQDMLGQSLERIFTPEDLTADRMAIEMHNALKTGRGSDERWHVRRDGERFWADGEMTVLRDAKGHAAGFVKVLRDRTSEHRAIEALSRSEASLRRAQEAGQVGVFSVGRDNLIHGTPAFCRIFGIDDCDGRSVAELEDLVVSDDRHLASNHERRSDGTGPLDTEYRICRADTGEERWIGRRAEFERDPDGNVLRLVGVVQDITDRKAAHRALSESETKFRAFTEAVPNQVWTARPDGSLDWANQRVYQYSGSSRRYDDGGDPMSGDAWRARVHPDDQDAAVVAWARALDYGEPYEVEFRLRRHDDVFRWHLARALPLKDDKGTVVRWIGTNTDIDDQHRAREALADLNAALERRVEEKVRERDRLWLLSEDMLARADYGGGMSAVNPAWTKVLGWTENELLTNPYADIIHPEDIAVTVAALQEMGETGRSTRFDNRIRTSAGDWTPIAWTVSPEPGTEYFIAVGRDMTAVRARERELALAQEALRQSQKLESMGQLTGGVAHDFNNLLTPIIGSLDMLMRRGLGSERERRLIDGALQSAERAKTLVQRLLAFARRQPLQPTAVNLPDLVNGMTELISSTLGPKIDVRVVLDADLPPAKADPNQLEMAILNLSVNARDAMPSGGDLTIAARREGVRPGNDRGFSPGHYICLSVSDTGSGMDEETRVRAIEPFFSTKGIGKGTGLGLSMAHGLAAQLGGGLSIHSAPGEGTTVELWLPISFDALTADTGGPILVPSSTARGTALLVDDEALVRMSTADMLSDLGYDVIEAASGEEAVALVEGGVVPEILVTDHLMPGMSGEDLARTLRASRPDLPVLIVSGYAEAEGLAPDLPRLTKPFRNAELAERLAILHPSPR